jgi:hypothetical protein
LAGKTLQGAGQPSGMGLEGGEDDREAGNQSGIRL